MADKQIITVKRDIDPKDKALTLWGLALAFIFSTMFMFMLVM